MDLTLLIPPYIFFDENTVNASIFKSNVSLHHFPPHLHITVHIYIYIDTCVCYHTNVASVSPAVSALPLLLLLLTVHSNVYLYNI